MKLPDLQKMNEFIKSSKAMGETDRIMSKSLTNDDSAETEPFTIEKTENQ